MGYSELTTIKKIGYNTASLAAGAFMLASVSIVGMVAMHEFGLTNYDVSKFLSRTPEKGVASSDTVSAEARAAAAKYADNEGAYFSAQADRNGGIVPIEDGFCTASANEQPAILSATHPVTNNIWRVGADQVKVNFDGETCTAEGLTFKRKEAQTLEM